MKPVRITGACATAASANLQYSGIVLGTLFGKRIPLGGWLGMAVIVLSGVTATFLRSHAAA